MLLRFRFRRSGASARGLGGSLRSTASNGTAVGRRPRRAAVCHRHTARECAQWSDTEPGSPSHSRARSCASIARRIAESHAYVQTRSRSPLSALRTSIVYEVLLSGTSLSRRGSNYPRYMRDAVARILSADYSENESELLRMELVVCCETSLTSICWAVTLCSGSELAPTTAPTRVSASGDARLVARHAFSSFSSDVCPKNWARSAFAARRQGQMSAVSQPENR